MPCKSRPGGSSVNARWITWRPAAAALPRRWKACAVIRPGSWYSACRPNRSTTTPSRCCAAAATARLSW
ncbi:MAG: hypothetical protein AMJ58_12540 [Gammaproteobacteria bacterium SG8_30]|nr:MAG: hypothetical protein AMJ58_12540 [Gammaproteobacteria bacterium SG8_30]